MSNIDFSSICIYTVGVIVGSFCGVVAGLACLVALIFATKYFKYSRSNSEETPNPTFPVATTH